MVCRSGPMGEEVMWNDGWGRPKPSAAKDTAPRARAAPARDEEGREPTEEWYPDAWKRLPQPRRRRRWGGQKGRRGRLLPPARQYPRRQGRYLPVGLEGQSTYGLTLEEAWHLLRRWHHTSRRGDPPWRRALRLAGNISAIKGDRVGNRAWGRAMRYKQ